MVVRSDDGILCVVLPRLAALDVYFFSILFKPPYVVVTFSTGFDLFTDPGTCCPVTLLVSETVDVKLAKSVGPDVIFCAMAVESVGVTWVVMLAGSASLDVSFL